MALLGEMTQHLPLSCLTMPWSSLSMCEFCAAAKCCEMQESASAVFAKRIRVVKDACQFSVVVRVVGCGFRSLSKKHQIISTM